MKLNRTGSNWTELERNKINENWRIIEGNYNDVVDKVSEEAFDKVVNSAKLNWKEPVDKYADLPSEASEGDTRMVRDSGKVYRFNGEVWQEIQQIDAGPVNELDDRLTTQLAEIDKVRFYESPISRKSPGMYASYVDDDGRKGVYTKLYPVFSDYGIPFTSALITSRLDDSTAITPAERDEMHESGLVEFLSHTHWHDPNHRPNDMTEEELIYDFSTSQQIIKNLGYNHRGLVLPFGDRSEKVLRIAKNYYDYVIGTGSGGPSGSGRVNYIGELDNQYLWRISLEYGFDYVKEKVDELVDRGYGWIIFVGHVDAGDWYTESYMRQVIDYVNSKGIEWVKTQDGINKIGNVMQFGQSKIGADGNIYSNELGRVVIDDSTSIVSSTPITYFKPNTVTLSKIRTNQTGGFPAGSTTGFLTTYRLSENELVWSYQTYITTRNKRFFIRYWNVEEGKWSGWLHYSPSQYVSTNSVTINTPPTAPEIANKRTYSFITATNAPDFPENKSGLLITNAFLTNNYAFQEYHTYRDSQIYKRWWDSDANTWTDFEPVNKTHLFPINTINEDTPPFDFDLGLTITNVSVSNNFLGGKAGVVTTFVTSKNERYIYQEFKENGTFNKYIRYANNDNTWSDWKKYVFESI